jgi:hypothetical protein
MFDGRNLDDAERMYQDWQAGLGARAAQDRELSARLAALTATARSDDDLIEVTIGASGDIVRLELAEGIRGRPAAETAREIVAAVRVARLALAADIVDVTARMTGPDSEAARAVIESRTRRLREPDD